MYSWFIGFQSTMMLRYGVLLTSSKRQTNQLTLDVLQTERRAYAQKASIKPTRGQEAWRIRKELGARVPKARQVKGIITISPAAHPRQQQPSMVFCAWGRNSIGHRVPCQWEALQHSRKHQQRLLRVLIWLFNVWKI